MNVFCMQEGHVVHNGQKSEAVDPDICKDLYIVCCSWYHCSKAFSRLANLKKKAC